MRSSPLAATGLAVLWVLLALLPARAQQPTRIGLTVNLVHVSPEPGEIDPRGRKLHRKLHKQFRYESLRVLGSRRFDLALDDIARYPLPTGGTLQLRPLDIRSNGVLIAVDVGNLLQTDLRVKAHHQAVIGAQRFQGGQLVITLEPDY